MIAHPVPEFLGDEGQERMEQAQGMGEDEVQDRQRVGAATPWLGVGALEVLGVAQSLIRCSGPEAPARRESTALLASTYRSQYSLQKKR